VTCEKGEVTELRFRDYPIVTALGDFRVSGRDVRAFREVAELREKSADTLVYEGISDDGRFMYVEFGDVVTVGETCEFLLFTSWLPPSQYPADAAMGMVRFASNVVSVTRVAIPKNEPVTPGTVDLLAELENEQKVGIRIVGLDGTRIYLKPEEGCRVLRFEQSRDYVRDVLAGHPGSRTLSYWISSTDTHCVKFTFAAK
jgi:hypothetical protein